MEVEYVSTSVSGDLAYTVAIERSDVRLADQPARSPMVLRVTHVFRKEDGAWMLVQLHASIAIGNDEAFGGAVNFPPV